MSDTSSHLDDAAADAARAASDEFADGTDAPAHAAAVPNAAVDPDVALATRVAMLLADLFSQALSDAVADAVRQAELTRALGDDHLVTRDEVATMLGVHPKTILRYEREGTLSASGNLGRAPVYSLGAVRAVARAAAGNAPVAAPRRGRPARGSRS